METTPITI